MEHAKNAQRLLAFFERQREDGTYYYADEEVRHFLPLLVLTMSIETGDVDWPPATKRMMDEFIVKIDLPDGAKSTPEQLQVALDAYYEAHPVNAELQSNFKAMVRELITEGSAGGLSAAAAQLIGAQQHALQPKDPTAEGVSVLSMMLDKDKDDEQA